MSMWYVSSLTGLQYSVSSGVACHTQKRTWVHIIGVKSVLQRVFFSQKWLNICNLSTHAYPEYDWVHIDFHHDTPLVSPLRCQDFNAILSKNAKHLFPCVMHGKLICIGLCFEPYQSQDADSSHVGRCSTFVGWWGRPKAINTSLT